MDDTQRLNWLSENFAFSDGTARFRFHPFRETWHATVKAKFPQGFWSRNYGPKDETNRWATLREAIDANSK